MWVYQDGPNVVRKEDSARGRSCSLQYKDVGKQVNGWVIISLLRWCAKTGGKKRNLIQCTVGGMKNWRTYYNGKGCRHEEVGNLAQLERSSTEEDILEWHMDHRAAEKLRISVFYEITWQPWTRKTTQTVNFVVDQPTSNTLWFHFC